MWDLWWTKWHWDRFFSEFFRFSPVIFIPLVFYYQETDKNEWFSFHDERNSRFS
jgi:hypothetical protein